MAPVAAVLTPDEHELLDGYRRLGPGDRVALMRIVQSMAGAPLPARQISGRPRARQVK